MMRMLSLMLALGLVGCDAAKECTLIACGSGLRLQVDSPVSEQELTGATLTYCWNDVCFSGALPPPNESDGYGLDLRSDDSESRVLAGVMKRPMDTPWIELDPVFPPAEVKDGDVYHVVLSSSDGKVLLQREEKVAHYETEYPNGPECGGACRTATIDRREKPH